MSTIPEWMQAIGTTILAVIAIWAVVMAPLKSIRKDIDDIKNRVSTLEGVERGRQIGYEESKTKGSGDGI